MVILIEVVIPSKIDLLVTVKCLGHVMIMGPLAISPKSVLGLG